MAAEKEGLYLGFSLLFLSFTLPFFFFFLGFTLLFRGLPAEGILGFPMANCGA